MTLEQSLQRLRFGGVHACGRLVEREQLRIRRERTRNLESSLIAVGEGCPQHHWRAPRIPT
jgi:hypothetical protein